jgi:hypothetical protein
VVAHAFNPSTQGYTEKPCLKKKKKKKKWWAAGKPIPSCFPSPAGF